MSVKKNDWVRSYSAGVWRVSAEVPAHFEPRASLQEPKELYDGPLFILKRIVNNKWKKAFALETAHAAFVKPLNKADTKKLETFLSQNADIVYPSGRVHVDFLAGRAAFISITAFFIFFAADLVDLPNVLWMLLQPIVR